MYISVCWDNESNERDKIGGLLGSPCVFPQSTHHIKFFFHFSNNFNLMFENISILKC